MSVFHAICKHCEKSLQFEKTKDDFYACPFCGQSFSYAELHAAGNIVDVETAREEYGLGQQYFTKADFRMAQRHFDKVREIDPNNFFAEYFYRLSEIKAINETGKLCGAEIIVTLLDEPIAKMSRSGQPSGVKRMFLSHAFSQAYELLRHLFDAIGNIYSKPSELEMRRKEYMIFARNIRRVTLVDCGQAMLADKDIGVTAVTICDLAMHALQLVVMGSVVENELRMPDSVQYNESRALFSVYSHFVRKIVPDYAFPHYREAYAETIAFNRKVNGLIDDYDRESRPSESSYLSVRGDKLTHLLYYCRTAFAYTYHTLFNGLGTRGRSSDYGGLICDALRFAFRLFMPRVFAEADGSKTIETLSYQQIDLIAKNLNNFCSELSMIDKNKLISAFDKFYCRLYELVRFHYNNQQTRIKAELVYARNQKNKQYFYYRNFLYGIVCCSLPALTELISYDKHHVGDRVKLLRLCKEAADDLLFLFDYRTEEIEKAPKFSNLPTVYNFINTNIKNFA